MQKKQFFKRLIDLEMMDENGEISLRIKDVKDWPVTLDIENWEIDSVSPGDEDDEKGEGYISGYAGGDWQDMTRFTILIPASGKPYCKLFDNPNCIAGKNIYKELKSLVKKELKEAQFKTKKRKIARSYEERKKLANRKRFQESEEEKTTMTYNQILKFLKTAKTKRGYKPDIYRADAEKTSEPIACLQAVIVDDGFRYEPDEDGYVIEMNPEFMHKTTVVAAYYPETGQFEDHWDDYAHEDMNGFEAQLWGKDKDGHWICTFVDTSAPDLNYGGPYDTLLTIVENKDKITNDKDPSFDVLKKVNSRSFRLDIHRALGEWDLVWNRYRAYSMEYEEGAYYVEDLTPAIEVSKESWEHLYKDDEDLQTIVNNIKEVFKKHGVPYFGTYIIPYSNGEIAEIHPMFAKCKDYDNIAADRWIDKPTLTEAKLPRRYPDSWDVDMSDLKSIVQNFFEYDEPKITVSFTNTDLNRFVATIYDADFNKKLKLDVDLDQHNGYTEVMISTDAVKEWYWSSLSENELIKDLEDLFMQVKDKFPEVKV